MSFIVHRRLLAVEEYLLLLPTTLLTVAATAFACLFALKFTPATALVAVNGLLAVAALCATWRGINTVRAKGEEALQALTPFVVFLMSVGLVLIGIGALAMLVESAAEQIDTGALPFNALGLPAVVPCAHLLWLRAMATAKGPVSGRMRPALVALGVAMLALQYIATGPLPFDRARWDASAHDGRDPWLRRQRMADWLILDGSLVGRSRADVVVRLGEPGYHASGVMGYPLGEGRGIGGFGDEMLWLPLDQDGQVKHAEVFNQD